MEGKRTKETTAGAISIPTGVKIGGEFKVTPNPTFIQERIKFFDEIYAKQQKILTEATKREIDITLPDGKIVKGKAWETTPLDIAKKISKKLAEQAVGAKVVYSKKDDSIFTAEVTDADDDGDHPKLEKGEIYDLTRPFEGDCSIEILKFDDDHGKTVFWHSGAHILGAALELTYGGHLCIGPPLENGFYYDVYLGDTKLHPSSFADIEKNIQKVVSENHTFQKIYLTKAEALELFKHNPFKVQLITYKIPENAVTTAYRCGPLIDLCTGPHLPSTGRAKAFKCTKASAAYWLGKNTNDDLQRVYGISFPTEKELNEYVKLQEEIAKRDHRNIGLHQELFFFSTLSPGSSFMYPYGAVIYNRLISWIRNEYKVRGYQEVVSPNMYNCHLWEISGHWFKYKDNMFAFKVEEQEFALKPMNCPGHCVLFDSILRTYRELPIRMADFGVLHRNEVSGALSGLTRVRRFQQDDAHIFCRLDQIQDEIMGCLDFLQHVYNVLGFEFKVELSTRPDNALGDESLWQKAEKALEEAIIKFGKPWKINAGDGAFYGPKIDIKVYDALKREHQLGTVQLDFNLPERFNLQYRTTDNVEHAEEGEVDEEKSEASKSEKAQENKKHKKEKKEKKSEKEEGPKDETVENTGSNQKVETSVPEEETKTEHSETSTTFKKIDTGHLKTGFQRPVMIHRAILGSVERMFAILCEHTGGKWPFWLSPRQCKVIPISEKFNDYAEAIYNRLKIEGYSAELDKSNFTINKKVRNSQIAQFNYIAVVGEEERSTGTVDLRERDNKDRLGKFSIQDLLKLFAGLQPKVSEAETNMKNKSFYDKLEKKDDELSLINEELLLKTFLDGDLQPGARDHEVYEKVKGIEIDAKSYPNLVRWKKFLEKSKQSS